MFTPLLGKLGDMFGKQRLLVISLAVFGLGSLAAAAGDSLGWLVACRVLQGTGAAVFPLAFGIIRDEFPAERVGVAVGVMSSVFGVGGGLGLVGSGFVLDSLSWHWLFILGGAPVLVAAALIWAFVPESPVRRGGRPDFLGAFVLSSALVSLLLAITKGEAWGWTSLPIAAPRARLGRRPSPPGWRSSAGSPSRWSTCDLRPPGHGAGRTPRRSSSASR